MRYDPVVEEYRAAHKADRKEIAELEKEVFDLKCALADARGDVETLKRIAKGATSDYWKIVDKHKEKWLEVVSLRKELESRKT